jgi:hypothetical protein
MILLLHCTGVPLAVLSGVRGRGRRTVMGVLRLWRRRGVPELLLPPHERCSSKPDTEEGGKKLIFEPLPAAEVMFEPGISVATRQTASNFGTRRPPDETNDNTVVRAYTGVRLMQVCHAPPAQAYLFTPHRTTWMARPPSAQSWPLSSANSEALKPMAAPLELLSQTWSLGPYPAGLCFPTETPVSNTTHTTPVRKLDQLDTRSGSCQGKSPRGCSLTEPAVPEAEGRLTGGQR